METTRHALANSQAVIAWIFIITGILATGFALFFLIIIRYSLFKGLALVLLLAGIFQLGYGGRLLPVSHNTPGERHHNTTLADEERAYVHQQMLHAGSFTWIALAGVALGILLFITFWGSAQTFWKGIGLGLMIQGMLTAALFQATIMELKSYKPSVTQAIAFQDKCPKKIVE